MLLVSPEDVFVLGFEELNPTWILTNKQQIAVRSKFYRSRHILEFENLTGRFYLVWSFFVVLGLHKLVNINTEGHRAGKQTGSLLSVHQRCRGLVLAKGKVTDGNATVIPLHENVFKALPVLAFRLLLEGFLSEPSRLEGRSELTFLLWVFGSQVTFWSA